MTSPKNILIFEPDASGHHSGYLYHLIINFLQNDYPYQLIVLVTPDFFQKHSQIIQKTISPRVKWVKFSETEFSEWQKPKNIFKRSTFEWQIFCKYAREYKAAHGLLMYLDYLQFSILTQSPPPCPVSGILFRPTLVNYHPNSLKEKLNYWRKQQLLKLIIKNKNVINIFNLDPFATAFIYKKWDTGKVKFLPDPVQIYPSVRSVEETKNRLEIEDGRIVFLIFGYLDSRKGILEMMETISEISHDESKKGCLLVVGPWEDTERKLFDDKLKLIRQSSDFQIVIQDRFVQDEDIQQYFELTDYVLALYQKHIGMSAIMVRAAAAQKPIISYNYGLMGKIILENELGIIISNNLKEKIEELLLYKNEIGDKSKMKAFAELNQAENYAKVILDNLQTQVI